MRTRMSRFLKTVGMLLPVAVVLGTFAVVSGAVRLPWPSAGAEVPNPPAQKAAARLMAEDSGK